MKNTIKRAARTFFQAAVGYLTANLTVGISGMDAGESVKGVIITLITAAVASGLAAVMNLPSREV